MGVRATRRFMLLPPALFGPKGRDVLAAACFKDFKELHGPPDQRRDEFRPSGSAPSRRRAAALALQGLRSSPRRLGGVCWCHGLADRGAPADHGAPALVQSFMFIPLRRPSLVLLFTRKHKLLETLQAYAFLVFVVVCVSGSVYLYVVLPETKNKTFRDISLSFAKINNMPVPSPDHETEMVLSCKPGASGKLHDDDKMESSF
ncbi:Solute carrier family 2, facilitated glucose transporter member 9 [Liparis tanakae]|uniref:Solute carrier family 2, facilitated glucose transporter member 9 n=1 Tax=Liparis tanakae TaxID=230148 RepID=A0A4Z2FUJ7_9TELE|nr:Solute carrier family 2, facilitated glucose transporter member 9 [Liparis tanakae]